VFTAGYVLLDKVGISYPKVLSMCPSLSPVLKDTIDEVAEHMNLNGYLVIIQEENSSGTICNQHRGHYGYTTLDNNRTDIYINNKILYLPNTLYNVLLHEVLHSIGLDHSQEQGIMSYAITENWYGSPVNDERRLWLSIDDLQGLYDIKYIQGAVNS
jgi:predicted Zn-dependent protease